MKRLFAAAGLALFLLTACGGTDRPEGVVERWLISLNQGRAAEPQKYASADATNSVLPGWQHCDPSALDVIEVGKGRIDPSDLDRGPGRHSAYVPYRIKYSDDLILFTGPGGGWRIAGLSPGRGGLKVPSEGGAPIGSAPLASWLLTLGASAGLMLLVGLLIRLTPTPTALPMERRP